MKKLITIILVFFSIILFSQSYIIKYSYDDAGNRVKREKIAFAISANMDAQLKTDTVVEQIADKNIRIYPNPVNETLNIFVEEYEGEVGILYLFSLNGRLIATKKITESNTKINFINQAPGSYIVKIMINNKTKEYTVVKNNTK
jgi:hypothetical protein